MMNTLGLIENPVGINMPPRRGLRFLAIGSTKIPLLTELETDECDSRQRISIRCLSHQILDELLEKIRRRLFLVQLNEIVDFEEELASAAH